MPHKVHDYTKKDGTHVREHDRKGGSGRKTYGPHPARAGRNARKGLKHLGKNRKGKAFGFLALALAEVLGFVFLNGLSLLLTLIAGVLVGISLAIVK